MGFRKVFMPAKIKATMPVMMRTKVTMYFVVSRTFQSFFHVIFYNIMIDQRGKGIEEENGQHPSFRIGWVDNSYNHTYHSNQKSIDQFPKVGTRSSHRIRGHKNDGKPKAAHDELILPWHRHKRGSPPHIKNHRHHYSPDQSTQHDSPTRDFCNQ